MAGTYNIHSRKERERRSRIAATDAAKNFGRLVDRVREERATYIVERGGKPVAQIGPVEPRHSTLADLAALFQRPSRLPEEYFRAVEAAVRRFNRPHVPKNPWER
jgi:antitoxin (DNA-binding transcriptional repressor) of toxin-antitoxin stability system